MACIIAKAFTTGFFYWPWMQAVSEEGHILDMAPTVQEMYKQLIEAAANPQAVVDGSLKVCPSSPQFYEEHTGREQWGI